MTEHRFRIEEVGDVEDAILYECTCTCGHKWQVYMDKLTDQPNPWEELCPKCGALDEEYELVDYKKTFRVYADTHKRLCICADCQRSYWWKRAIARFRRWRMMLLGR